MNVTQMILAKFTSAIGRLLNQACSNNGILARFFQLSYQDESFVLSELIDNIIHSDLLHHQAFYHFYLLYLHQPLSLLRI